MRKKSFIKLAVLLVITALCITGSSFILFSNFVLGVFMIVIVTLFFGYAIIKHYNVTLQKIATMFDAIDNDDFTFRFSGTARDSMSDFLLHNSLNRIKDLVLAAREEAREREKFFEIILNRVNTGIVVINKQGSVIRTNKKSIELLQLSQLSHINQLSYISDDIVRIFSEISEGESRQINFYNESTEVILNISATDIILQERALKIIAIVDIQSNIDKAEVDSWSRISRVLTHEIMNSLAPITSLTETLITSDDQKIIQRGLSIIGNTAKELKSFVENYRTLTRVPIPVLEDIDIAVLITNEIELLGGDIEINTTCTNYSVNADKGLISQVIANLLKNAKEACDGNKLAKIWIDIARNRNNRLYVDICNNGQLITDEIRENIFVPFFTTKENGSGIGLSLSRQIMRLHEGSLSLTTQPHTRFRIQF